VNKFLTIAAGSALVAFSASAQEIAQAKVTQDLAQAKMRAETEAMVHMKMMGAVKGMTVKGAPYSAEEVTESTQVLADGTRIHRENKVSVYRDGEGRVRRETPETVTITDPVANVSYMLNSKSMTGQKLPLEAGNFVFLNPIPDAPGKGTVSTFTMTTNNDGPVSITVNGEHMDEKQMAEAMAKAKESGRTVTYERRYSTTSDVKTTTGGPIGVAAAGGAMGWTMAVPAGKKTPGESLGTQVIEGVNAEGTRNVQTIEAGAIGNDRPISITSENWYSPDLKMTVMTKRSDPRTGEETFRVTNIQRGEPGSYLFQPPAGYQINERK
jgi:hypothetical protein